MGIFVCVDQDSVMSLTEMHAQQVPLVPILSKSYAIRNDRLEKSIFGARERIVMHMSVKL